VKAAKTEKPKSKEKLDKFLAYSDNYYVKWLDDMDYKEKADEILKLEELDHSNFKWSGEFIIR